MSTGLAKLGFVHRRLWQRDGTYRLAVLLGPPPLLGAAVAAALWAGLHAATPAPPATAPPAWAAVSGPRTGPGTDPPRAVAPGMELPAAGLPSNLVTGWQGGIQPVEIDATMDANVLPTRSGPLVLDQPELSLERIIAAGRSGGRFVGVGMAMLVVRSAGTYGLALRLQRADTQRLACLQRLVFAGQRVVSSLQLDMTGPATLDFEPVSFELKPGLYPIAAAFGCWDGPQAKGVATLSVLVRHPGEQELRPARPDEIMRSAVARP